jgi:hypothetical protein
MVGFLGGLFTSLFKQDKVERAESGSEEDSSFRNACTNGSGI